MTISLDEWREAGHTYVHHGHPIFYVDHHRGDGPVLLCIHGFPTASWDFADTWRRLTGRFARVIVADMIGFGFSAKPRGYDYNLVDQTDLQQGLAMALGVHDVHVLAHDYGVSVAQELLARHAEGRGLRLHSVALLNGGLFPETHHARPIQKLLLGPFGPIVSLLSTRRKFLANLADVFGPGTKPTPEQEDAFWTLWCANGGSQGHRLIRYILDRRIHRDRWVGALTATRVPLLLINGPEDPVSGAHMVARYRELVPWPNVVSLPGIGHYPQVEAPDAVMDAYDTFLDRLEADGAH
jgi:pimeloyl-ACP methyl ester carboxylesterase